MKDLLSLEDPKWFPGHDTRLSIKGDNAVDYVGPREWCSRIKAQENPHLEEILRVRGTEALDAKNAKGQQKLLCPFCPPSISVRNGGFNDFAQLQRHIYAKYKEESTPEALTNERVHDPAIIDRWEALAALVTNGGYRLQCSYCPFKTKSDNTMADHATNSLYCSARRFFEAIVYVTREYVVQQVNRQQPIKIRPRADQAPADADLVATQPPHKWRISPYAKADEVERTAKAILDYAQAFDGDVVALFESILEMCVRERNLGGMFPKNFKKEDRLKAIAGQINFDPNFKSTSKAFATLEAFYKEE